MKHAKPVLSITVLFFAMCASAVAGPYDEGSKPEGRRGPPPFSSLDLDGDGYVTLSEFKQHKIPAPDYARIFDHIDADGDGLITETEFNNHRPPRRPY